MLDEIAAGPAPAALPARPGQITKIRYTHEDCIDRIIADPTISQGELARIYGYSEGWMSILVNTDAFKARLADRRAELIDPVVAASLNEKYAALANRSVEVLLDKLNRPLDAIPDKLALEAAALGARVTGLDRPAPAPSAPAADHLASIAHRLLDLQRPRGEVIEMPNRA